MPRDFYSVLGVAKEASKEEVKKAYRRLSKELHPDKHPGDKEAERKFKEINEAYEVLSDPEKRQQYDQFGTTAGPGGQGGPGGFGGFDFSGFQGFSNGDFGGLGDLFEGFFSGGGRGRKQKVSDRGGDREARLSVPFMDAVHGAEKQIMIDRLTQCGACSGSGGAKDSSLKDCEACGGTGQRTEASQSFFGVIRRSFACDACSASGKVHAKPCGACKGEGRLREHSAVSVQIPAGIQTGQTLRVNGYGDAGRRGDEAGDLYLHIEVEEDRRFQRDGDDIRTALSVSVVDAILGAEKEIETVHGRKTLKIPAGTQPGQVFRMKGKGMPILSSSRTGDHYTEVKVIIPEKLSRAEREVVEQWKKMQGD
ncbi:MAG: molecular chaperone DnaJ [Candidatus Peregrinibacteria bacterium]